MSACIIIYGQMKKRAFIAKGAKGKIVPAASIMHLLTASLFPILGSGDKIIILESDNGIVDNNRKKS